MPVIVSVKVDHKIYLLSGKDTVRDFETVQKGLSYFERSYHNGHARGYEGSMSACLNYMTFHPAIHEWNHEDLSPLIEQGVLVPDTFHAYSLSHDSGHMIGALCTGEKAEEFHNKGITPQLI